jgi:glycerol-3-phosphate dehydrogenase (NAD(P)+)
MGRWIGGGLTYREAKAKYKPNETVEGPYLAISIGSAIRKMIKSGELDGDRLPLLCSLIDVIVDERPFEIPWDSFFC